MWSKKSKTRPKSGAADTLITVDTKITGDISFSGVLFVDGHIKGNDIANENNHSLLTVGAQGHIEGEVKVPQVVIYGYINGDVHATENLNLQKDSRVEGNVYYNLLEMAKGASVNGKLVKKDMSPKLLNHKPNNDKKNDKESDKESDKEVDELQTALDG